MTSTALVVYTKNFSLRPEAYQPPLFRRITYYAEPVIWRDERSPGRPLGGLLSSKRNCAPRSSTALSDRHQPQKVAVAAAAAPIIVQRTEK